MHPYEPKIQEMFSDRVGIVPLQSQPLTSIEAVSALHQIGLDLIKMECGNVDAIADSVGVVLTQVLARIDIPVIPEFVEVQLESLLVGLVVVQIKRFGHAHCKH
jgi:hypothetical protein